MKMNFNSIGGELAFKIDSINISKPYNGFQDLSFKTADGNFLHICGENNMVELLESALEAYRKEEIVQEVQKRMASNSKSIF